jgi:hypothetical protein
MMAETTRVQMELPLRSHERLLALKEKTEATTYAEVMKNALRLYEAVLQQHDAGRRMYMKGEDGALVEFVMFV